ncbi:MAG TPA: FAD-dependent oxidoreductase [Actinophytocola sp.]|uniref:FAD/NAD(P)-dependent oxidoreductase n=1 Tax=Actinophytocola sp. TaxID=1872138 RepID=UPI002DDD366F|nr:FAD-dependent oxidoreductase [Actinophytocola sp.]HEV2784166.1 FAD-dependent oxidoreductase [Actinophytocola sp.]
MTGYDVAVIGAGPAGLSAAAGAADAGERVVLLDAAVLPGGQYWRHRQHFPPESTRYRKLAGALSRVDHRPGTAVWFAEPGFTLHTTTGEITAARLILATGAHDRVVPFPGWDLPGVTTAGGAQALLKGHGVLVGRRIVVAGTGPFLLPVAATLARAGARVVGVFEANHPLRMARHFTLPPAKLAEAARYAATFARHRIPYHTGKIVVAAHGKGEVEGVTVAPAHSGKIVAAHGDGEADGAGKAPGSGRRIEGAAHGEVEGASGAAAHHDDKRDRGWGAAAHGGKIAAAHGDRAGDGGHRAAGQGRRIEGAAHGEVERASGAAAHHDDKRDGGRGAAAHGDDWAGGRGRKGSAGVRRVACDALAVGYGFVPAIELATLLGCATRMDGDGNLVVAVDEAQRTSVPGVWAAGEITGVGGADLAMVEGAIAGLGRVPPGLARRRARLRRFAAALHAEYPVPGGWAEHLREDTTVCRCEEVPFRTVREAVAELGAVDARTVKLLSRTGMGWCQGRMCGFAVACLTARLRDRPVTEADLAAFAHRPFAAPITLGELAAGADLIE